MTDHTNIIYIPIKRKSKWEGDVLEKVYNALGKEGFSKWAATFNTMSKGTSY
tara:strand:+ start:85 stop:240 length:156 start_codon:yes stop_codon:yes gene_type:complete